MHIDASTEFGARVLRRLQEETIIWLVTVGPNGIPQPSPVWFLWADDTVLMYSEPDKPKVRNIPHNPNVALHFDSDGRGGNIVVLTGEARLLDDAPPPGQLEAYLRKYAQGIRQIGLTPEGFQRTYSVAIRFEPAHLRGD